jgi:acyl carrier protein
MMGAYSAASGFQDAFAEAHDGRDGIRCLSLAWSNWEGVGQSRAVENRDLPRSRGYRPMPPRQALQSLFIAMSRRDPTLIVGLDGDHPHIQRYRGDVAIAGERLRVYYSTPRGPVPRRALDALDLRDEFGAISRPVYTVLAEMPLTRSGDVAIDELERLGEGVERPGPQSDRERRLAEIWKRALAVPSVSVADGFFDLGGDSLLAARVLGEIREQFGVDVTLRQLFDAPTLGDLARTVEAAAPSRPSPAAPVAEGAPGHLAALLERLDDIGDEEVDALLRGLADERVVGE